jgi:hypothetical protein
MKRNEADDYENFEEQIGQVSMGMAERIKSRPKYLNDFQVSI